MVDPILLVDPEFDLETFRKLPKREQNSRYGKLLIDRFEKADAPRITIHRAIETGPVYEQWPPDSHEMIRGKKGQPDDEIVRAFATRAFRRPVSEEQIVPYLRLARTSPEGLRSAIEASQLPEVSTFRKTAKTWMITRSPRVFRIFFETPCRKAC